MKNVLVTGATSFIGANLTNRLLELGHTVYATVRPGAKGKCELSASEFLHILEAPMSEYLYLGELIDKPIDTAFFLAWDGTRGLSREDKDLQQRNYEYSLNGLESASKLGCETIISAGSQAEYGQYNCKINEDTFSMPVTQYGKYKLKFFEKAYEICKVKNIGFKEARLFSIYGINDSKDSLIISSINNMLHNLDCNFTESLQIWDYLYVDDAIDGLIALTQCICQDGIYNFGSGDSKPLKEYIEQIYEVTNSKSKLIFGSLLYPTNGIVNLNPDISKLIRETGWFPKVSFQEGIEKIIKSKKSL